MVYGHPSPFVLTALLTHAVALMARAKGDEISFVIFTSKQSKTIKRQLASRWRFGREAKSFPKTACTPLRFCFPIIPGQSSG